MGTSLSRAIRWWSAAPVAALGVVAGAAPAQVRDSASLAPIVVTATPVPRPVDRLPQRVSVLFGTELRAAGFTTVADALAGLPGLSVVRTGAAGAATSVFVRGGESDYVKVLVDGVPANEPGGAYDFANLSLDNVDRIEVVRGPVSVLYGSDAVAGVIQVFTNRAGTALVAGARAGTYGTVEAEATLAVGTDPGGISAAGRWYRTDGLYAFNNQFDHKNLSAGMRLAPDAATRVGLSLRVTDAAYHFPTDGAGILADSNQVQLTDVTSLGLEVTRELGARVDARLAVALNAIGGGLDDAPDGPGDTLGFYAFRSQRDLERRGVDSRVVLHLEPVTLVAGAAVEHQRERSTSRGAGDFGAFEDAIDGSRLNWAGYTQVGGDVGPVSLMGGARVDDNERFGTFVTYRTGASVRAGPARLFGSFGSAFKEPTFFEQLGGGFVTGNPDLRPERTTSWEAGVEQTALGGRVRAAATYFGQRFRDLIQFTFTPSNPGDPNYVNLAAANADGAEVELDAHPAEWLAVSAQYTYLETEVTDAGVLPDDDAAFRRGDRLLRRPTHTIGVRAFARLSRASLSGAVRRVGERADADFSTFPADRVSLPAYVVVDAAAEISLLRLRRGMPEVALTARIENLFDERYEEAFGFPARGRTVLVGGKVRM